jgi:hypothetical protein
MDRYKAYALFVHETNKECPNSRPNGSGFLKEKQVAFIPTSMQIRGGGAMVMIGHCEDCGKPYWLNSFVMVRVR